MSSISVLDFAIRGLLGTAAICIGWAYWRRRSNREHQQRKLEASRIADRTHQLAAEKDLAEQANRIKTQLLTGISQDIRQPLNDILNTLEQALMTDLTAEQ